MLHFEPDFGRGHLLLAKAYYFNGRPDLADGHFKKAFTIMSGYAKKATNATAENFYLGYEKQILFDWARMKMPWAIWTMALYPSQAQFRGNNDAPVNMSFVYSSQSMVP